MTMLELMTLQYQDLYYTNIVYVNSSFIHSYSFNVQVDITQLQTDRKARKKDRIIYIGSS